MNTSILALAFFAEKRKKVLKHLPVLSAVEVPQYFTQMAQKLCSFAA